LTLLTFALAVAATSSPAAPGLASELDGSEWAQVTIRQTVVIRVPSATPAPQIERGIQWKEQKGPKCVSMNGLGGFAITTPDSIDLIVKGGARYRARLERGCPSVAFYSGFYIRPPADGRICVGRDMVHSRTGGECEIEKFRTLVPAR
jgi:hypothetical protein